MCVTSRIWPMASITTRHWRFSTVTKWWSVHWQRPAVSYRPTSIRSISRTSSSTSAAAPRRLNRWSPSPASAHLIIKSMPAWWWLATQSNSVPSSSAQWPYKWATACPCWSGWWIIIHTNVTTMGSTTSVTSCNWCATIDLIRPFCMYQMNCSMTAYWNRMHRQRTSIGFWCRICCRARDFRSSSIR